MVNFKLCKFFAALALVVSFGADAAPQEFQAKYELYRNGKLMGSSQISLTKSGDRYQFETFSASEGGWVSVLGGAEIKETSTFTTDGVTFKPERYSYVQSISFKKKTRDLQFNWGNNWVDESDGKKTQGFALLPGALDRNLIVLALAWDLRGNKSALVHPVAYKGEVTSWTFANKGVEPVKTSMGVIAANRIERVRENKDRSTTSWHAAQFGFLPVKISQVEPDGESIEMRLKAMVIKPLK